MKNIFKFLFLMVTTFSYSQSYSEKWNNLENRYEYFNSQGYMVAYKSYDNINRQWNYYEVRQQEVFKPTSSVNLPLVQQVLATRQNAYNTNAQRINDAVSDMRNWLNNSNIDEDTKIMIRHTFNKFHLEPMYANGYDFSDTAFVNQIIQGLYSAFNERVAFFVNEINK